MISHPSSRFWQVDYLRGLAVLGMIGYHFVFDLYLLGKTSLDPFGLPLLLAARLIAATFLALVGLSFYLAQQSQPNPNTLFHQTIKRVLVLSLAGTLVTLATYLVNPLLTVRFGILQLIALSLLLLFTLSFIKSRLVLLLILVLFLLPLPITASPSFDYYPLFPWFAVVLTGYFLGPTLYPNLTATQAPRYLTPVTRLGRHSLTIYLLHQPILLTTLLLLT